MENRIQKNRNYSLRRNLFVAGFLWLILSIWASPAAAQYQCTNTVYFTSVNNTNVYSYTLGGGITQLSGISIAGSSAASAIKPDGTRLYSVNNVSPYRLHHNSGSTTNSAGTSTGVDSQTQRNAIAPNGTGYFMEGEASAPREYRTYTTSGTTPVVSGATTLTLQPSTAPDVVNGGDIAFDANGIGYLIDQGRNFYRLDFSNNTVNYLGVFSGTMDGNPNGLGFVSTTTAGQNFLYASTLNNRLYRLDLAAMTVNLVTPTSTASGFTQNDIASCIYPTILPNVAATKAWRNVTKGDPDTFTTSTAASVGDTLEYRVVVRNTGVIAAGNMTFQDTIPSGMTYVANSTRLNSATANITDNGGSGNARFYYGSAQTIQGYGQSAGSGVLRVDSTSGTLTDNEAVVIFRVTVNNPFDGAAIPVLNTAQVRHAGQNPGTTTTVNSNQTSTPVSVPDLQIAKSHTGNFVRGSTGTYTITVTNAGTAATSGTITVTDTLPAGMTVNGGLIGSVTPGGANAANWSCNSNAALPQTISCTSSTAIPTASGSNSSTFTLTVNIGLTTAASVSNQVAVSGGGEPALNNANNQATDPTTIISPLKITGTVFEDSSYAGGAGRSLSASGGTGRGGARVELYNSLGIMLFSTTTSTASGSVGQYEFLNLPVGSYTVRVVNSTVSSARVGYLSSLIGVQTFRTNEGAADTNRVGGEDPTKTDAGANTLGASLASLIFGGTITPQSISSISNATGDISGVDFGFNFDTIVNVNDSGQGSLRQFITNANALSGADTSIFMIPDGASHAGLRSGLTNQLTGGVAVINLASVLPALTDSLTTIDGTTQTANVGNTNSGALGTGGTVGVDNLTLSTVQKPEVQIADGANLAIGLDLQATSLIVRGVSIYGFGTSSNNNDHANIRLGSSAANALIEGNILGSAATALTDPGIAARSTGDNIRSAGADNGIVRNNLIAFSAGKGFGVEDGSIGWLIENNEIRGNGIGNSNLDGIDLETSGTTGNIVRGNLIYANEGVGVDSYGSNGSNTIVNNTITGNGIGSNSNVETPGVRIYGSGNTIDRNKIYANYGAGVMITTGASSNTITRNSIYANGTITTNTGGAASNQIGIDLQNSTDNVNIGTPAYVTLNDSSDADSGGNDLLNFPILETAQILNGNLVLKGFARPGATLEFFVAAPDATGFGEGQTYVVTLTEGSGADADATAAAYTSPFNGKTVGADITNRFSFSLALPSGVSNGTILTATATLSGATSEFSNTIAVGNAPPSIGLVKTVTPDGTQLPGTELTYTISFTNTGGQSATNFILTDPNPANATLKLNTNTDFKINSVVGVFPTGLTAVIAFSNDGGTTFTYTPVSAGGGAAAGYDRNVTHIRWTFAGGLSPLTPSNTGSVSFTVKIR